MTYVASSQPFLLSEVLKNTEGVTFDVFNMENKVEAETGMV